MIALERFVGPIVEAWGEVKVQKARVILSLVGVVAAVAAMSTVIALGELVVHSNREMMEAYAGRTVTLHVTATKKQDDSAGGASSSALAYREDGSVAGRVEAPRKEGTSGAGGTSAAPGAVADPVGEAMATVAERFAIPYWSRQETGSLIVEELKRAQDSGSFRGRPVKQPSYGPVESVSVMAVDPAYSTLFRVDPSQGRWIDDSDADLRLVPIVVNSILWDVLGRAPIEEPIVLTASDGSGTRFRIVGVVEAMSPWDHPSAYVDYTAWQYVKTGAAAAKGESASHSSPDLLVWAGPAQAEKAREVLPKALASVLGKGWEGGVYGGEKSDNGESQLNTARMVIMVIGGIVIFLGALGLLNVAIVTVRQRIREIGIRRAMGASARRVFFAVFMESVVATFVAGVIGVGMAIVILRFLPLESLDIVLRDRPAFPMGAAIDGVGISTAIGALCGIIPAVAAVRVKPIDAIRY